MKYKQEFRVTENVAKVWEFFEQFERVAQCVPGVQKAEVIDSDNVIVTLAQRLGPMTATFDAKVQITERIVREKIEFSSTGKAVRGAIGNFRSTNTVFLTADGEHTHVTVTGDVALGGALGSVGEKVIAKQAEKVTTEFSRNLELALSGKAAPASGESGAPQAAADPAPRAAAPGPDVPRDALPAVGATSELWSKVSAALSGAALIVGLIVLWNMK
ncbi:MAG: carbon monoxide dehydrogenase subunit [Marmoricola sp.]|nr:carbon monoxide dehydrogenase subunit [Marmoricola sp.]